MANKALGRGLNALIPQKEIKKDESGIRRIKTDHIKPNVNQPRTVFSDDKLNDLKNSIGVKGILQPIIVKEIDGNQFEIIAGERRFRAAQSLGWNDVPCIVKKANEIDSLELALIENIQRENLNPIEEARAYKKLIDEHQFTHQHISETIGKERSTITNTLRLLTLPEKVIRYIEKDKLTSGHAKALLGLSGPIKQERVADLIVNQNLTVREAERVIGQKKKEIHHLSKGKDKNILQLEEELRMIFGTKVNINNKSKNKGKIEIQYFSLNDLDRVLSIIRGKKET